MRLQLVAWAYVPSYAIVRDRTGVAWVVGWRYSSTQINAYPAALGWRNGRAAAVTWPIDPAALVWAEVPDLADAVRAVWDAFGPTITINA